MTCYSDMWEIMDKHSFQMRSDVISNLTCIICQKLLIDAWEGSCRCRYCKKCIDTYLAKGNQMCPKGDEGCLPGIIEQQFYINRNNLANKQISQLETQCPLNNCEYKCSLHDMSDHLKVCGGGWETLRKLKDKTENVTLDETSSHLLNALHNHLSTNRKWIKRATKYINSCGHRTLTLPISNLDDLKTFSSANSFLSGQTIEEETFSRVLSDMRTIKRKSDEIVSRIYDSAERYLRKGLEEKEIPLGKVNEDNEELEISIEIIDEFPESEENPNEKVDEYAKLIEKQAKCTKRLANKNELAVALRLKTEKQDKAIQELKMEKKSTLKEKIRLEKELKNQRKQLSKSNQENEKLKKEIKDLQQTEKGWLKKWMPMTPVKDFGNSSNERVAERTIGLFVCHFNRISHINATSGSDKFYFTNRFIDVWIRLWPNGCKYNNHLQRDAKRLCLDFLIDDGIIRHEENDRRHPRTYEVKLVLKSKFPNSDNDNNNNNNKTVSQSQRFEFDGIKSYAKIFSPSQFHFLKSDISENQIIGNDDSLLVECQIHLTNQ